MMQTQESRFQHQIHHILRPFKADYDEEIANGKTYSFDDYLWHYRAADFGKAVIEATETWCGLDEALNSED